MSTDSMSLELSGRFGPGASAREAFLGAVTRARAACEVRLVARAIEYARRLDSVLTQFRLRQGLAGHSAALVSVAMDEFIGEARSAAQVVTGQSKVPVLEDTLASLEHMYVASESALSVGTMQPGSFMPGAEMIAMSAVRTLRSLESLRATEREQVPVDVDEERGAPRHESSRTRVANDAPSANSVAA